jgi:hypothetical protein
MLTPRLVVSMLGCALALSLAACSQQTTASLYRVHDDPALRAHTQATAQTTSKDPTVGQLWSSFQTSLAAAKSMRIAGTLHIDKKAATVDLSGTCDGSNGRSTITMDNQNLEVTTVSGTYYVKANGAYWRAHGMAPAQIIEIGSRYLATTDAAMGQFNVSSILGSLKTTEPITDGMGVIAEKSSLTRGTCLPLLGEDEGRTDDDLGHRHRLHAAQTEVRISRRYGRADVLRVELPGQLSVAASRADPQDLTVWGCRRRLVTRSRRAPAG